jgi:enoyl-CoA hydratase/carnithine racemase
LPAASPSAEPVAGDNYTGYAHPVLPNMNTLGNALYVGLTGKTLTADEALRMGLIAEVVPNDALMARATELAQIVAQRDPEVVQHQKELLRLSSEVPGSFLLRLQELMKRVGPRRSDNIDETTEAFLEHRNRTR